MLLASLEAGTEIVIGFDWAEMPSSLFDVSICRDIVHTKFQKAAKWHGQIRILQSCSALFLDRGNSAKIARGPSPTLYAERHKNQGFNEAPTGVVGSCNKWCS
jgi:hypothetical protein